MSGGADDKSRIPLPRWRYASRVRLNAEHCGDPNASRNTTFSTDFAQIALSEFERNPTLSTAAELAQAGVVANDRKLIQRAASFLQSAQKKIPEELRSILDWNADPLAQTALPSQHDLLGYGPDSQAAKVIRAHRQSLIADPRNVVLWLDMGRAYAVLGLTAKAEYAMRMAHALSPNHRVVLRTNARWLTHANRPDEALRLLQANPRTKTDPWLMSVEIALTAAQGKAMSSMVRGRRLIDDYQRSPGFVTELASSVATNDWMSGDHRRSRKLFQFSLQAPTDNSVAQAHWMAGRERLLDLPLGQLTQPEFMEGRYWQAVKENRWPDALNEVRAWQEDEPFSSRPAINGTYLAASYCDDALLGVEIGEIGLRANPQNQMLRNNLAVALVHAGRAARAIEVFEGIRAPLDPGLPQFVYLATVGLLNYAAGSLEAGGEYFKAAWESAPTADRIRVEIAQFEAESLIDAAAANHLALPLTRAVNDAGDSRLSALFSQSMKSHQKRLNESSISRIGSTIVLADGRQITLSRPSE